MSYQKDIYTALAGNATLAAIVGNRIFPDIADGTAVAPYVVYTVVSTGGETTHDGDRNLDFPLVQFSIYAITKAAAIAAASALNAILDGNTLSGASNISFQFSNQSGTYESDTKLFGEILEYRSASNTN